jgi:hypothetical protein
MIRNDCPEYHIHIKGTKNLASVLGKLKMLVSNRIACPSQGRKALVHAHSTQASY